MIVRPIKAHYGPEHGGSGFWRHRPSGGCPNLLEDPFESQVNPLNGNWTQFKVNGNTNWNSVGPFNRATLTMPNPAVTTRTVCMHKTPMCTDDQQVEVDKFWTDETVGNTYGYCVARSNDSDGWQDSYP